MVEKPEKGKRKVRTVWADFDGTGIDYIGIFRNETGLWAILGISRVYFGADGDIPVTR